MKKRLIILCALCLALFMAVFTVSASAKDLDEILNFTVTVDVNDDATLNMVYHIDWKVLDSDSEGPLSWVQIGIPNRNYVDLKALTSTIRNLSYYSSGGTKVRIDLDRNYYKDEVASFDFLVVQDYMYQIDRFQDGQTVYDFTPAWFDDINVDELVIKWNADQVLSIDPPAQLTSDGYYTWTASLGKGEYYEVRVTYENEAFGFDVDKSDVVKGGSGYNNGGYEYDDTLTFGDVILGLIGLVFFLGPFIIVPVLIIRTIMRYTRSANFSSTDKKITRTKVVYYPNCPGCGAPRPEGANNCEYCGRSFIKSEEKIEEKDIPKAEKELRYKTTSGLYPYSTVPNTYIRINVTPAPSRPRSTGSSGFWGGGTGGSSSSSRSSSSHSSSHHSSCAHSSCACACACACASSGRAGCSNKDFYNTDLKLRQLEMKEKDKK